MPGFSRQVDRKHMQRAVELARSSRAEEDKRIHPLVGAVIVHPSGKEISFGFRGMKTRGNHAEQEALIGIRDDALDGAIVYSTLEPCTFRGKQMPCCHRLLNRGIKEVVIGMLDPNREIRGMGWWKFEEAGISVRNFDADLVKKIREMNKDFIADQLGYGIRIEEIVPENGEPIHVTQEHRLGQLELKVKRGKAILRGTYTNRPPAGHRLRLFQKRDVFVFPQAPINFDFDRENRLWECNETWFSKKYEGSSCEIVIADLSEDLMVTTSFYSRVHSELASKLKDESDAWVGIPVNPEPTGLKVLDRLRVQFDE
jgi:pyrimidine deaminase RibD-like protein